MRHKRISLIEMIITIMLFVMVLGTLRFMIVDMMRFTNEINHNADTLSTMQNVIITLDSSLKKAYEVDVSSNKLTLMLLKETIDFEVRDDFLYRNNIKLIPLKNVMVNFEDDSDSVNGGQGKKIIKANFTYEHKLRKGSKVYSFSRYIGTLE